MGEGARGPAASSPFIASFIAALIIMNYLQPSMTQFGPTPAPSRCLLEQ
jgi:hypothetical protein